MAVTVRAFVETPAGSRVKFVHDEASFAPLRELDVPVPYPCAYGFLPDHVGGDGECFDCFLLANRTLGRGEHLDATVVGLIEQWESGVPDHKVLCVPLGETTTRDAQAEEVLAFMQLLGAARTRVAVSVGPIRDAAIAAAQLARTVAPRRPSASGDPP